MEISLLFDADEETLKKCSEIIGQTVKSDKSGNSEIQIAFSEIKVTDRTKMIQTMFAGVDHVDFTKIREDITLCSNAGAFSNTVAEHVFALVLSHMKKIVAFDQMTRSGKYQKEPVEVLEGKTMGIAGYGGIGKRVARIAKAFDMKVLGFTRSPVEDPNVDEYMKSLEELAGKSDIFVLALPLTTKTAGIIDRRVLDSFRGDVIVNVARADIVNKDDMLEYLHGNQKKSYLTDVWWGEPELRIPIPENALLTPHIAGISEISFDRALMSACENVRKYLEGKPENVVDVKEYQKH